MHCLPRDNIARANLCRLSDLSSGIINLPHPTEVLIRESGLRGAPSPRCGHCSIVVGGDRLMIFGGYDSHLYCFDVERQVIQPTPLLGVCARKTHIGSEVPWGDIRLRSLALMVQIVFLRGEPHQTAGLRPLACCHPARVCHGTVGWLRPPPATGPATGTPGRRVACGVQSPTPFPHPKTPPF